MADKESSCTAGSLVKPEWSMEAKGAYSWGPDPNAGEADHFHQRPSWLIHLLETMRPQRGRIWGPNSCSGQPVGDPPVLVRGKMVVVAMVAVKDKAVNLHHIVSHLQQG